jgi:hypothetical protein
MTGTKRPSAVPGLRSAITGSQPEAAVPPAPPPVTGDGLDDALLARWRWSLGASSRKAAAARAKAAAAMAAWERLVADARQAGIPERLVVGAAADADLDVPE